jgi:hypothetical protein
MAAAETRPGQRRRTGGKPGRPRTVVDGHKLEVLLTREDYTALKSLSEQQAVPMAILMRLAIHQYLLDRR